MAMSVAAIPIGICTYPGYKMAPRLRAPASEELSVARALQSIAGRRLAPNAGVADGFGRNLRPKVLTKQSGDGA